MQKDPNTGKKEEVFANKILLALNETIFNKDSEHYIDVPTVLKQEELNALLFALLVLAPSSSYAAITGDEGKDGIDMIALATRLLFQFIEK